MNLLIEFVVKKTVYSILIKKLLWYVLDSLNLKNLKEFGFINVIMNYGFYPESIK